MNKLVLIFTNSKFGSVIFLGEVVAVAKDKFSSPHIYGRSYCQVGACVEIFVNSSGLRKTQESKMKPVASDEQTHRAGMQPSFAKKTMV